MKKINFYKLAHNHTSTTETSEQSCHVHHTAITQFCKFKSTVVNNLAQRFALH